MASGQSDQHDVRIPYLMIIVQRVFTLTIKYPFSTAVCAKGSTSMLPSGGKFVCACAYFILKRSSIYHLSQVWLQYSGAKELMEENPQVYRSLVQSAELMGSHNEHRNIIYQGKEQPTRGGGWGMNHNMFYEHINELNAVNIQTYIARFRTMNISAAWIQTSTDTPSTLQRAFRKYTLCVVSCLL